MIKSWPLNSLTESDRLNLKAHASSILGPGIVLELPDELQGFCSYTLHLSRGPHSPEHDQAIVQFRPMKFALDTELTRVAKAIYGEYAPITLILGHFNFLAHGELQITLQTCVPGSPYSRLHLSAHRLEGNDLIRHKRLVTSFADFIARGWTQGRSSPYQRCLTGKVGVNLAHRLRLLSCHLPDDRLRKIAYEALKSLHRLDSLPVVLTHGDTIPSNIVVNTTTHSIEGFIDWAEAEWLPFGMCLYGLEHLLGYVSADGMRFVYYSSSQALRRHFWLELNKRILVGDTETDPGPAINLARDIGVLLWYGFAWDDGAIDRVISGRHDLTELMYLQTFLPARSEALSARL